LHRITFEEGEKMDLFEEFSKGLVPCTDCRAGMMRPMTRINSRRIILECCNCGKKDDLELREDEEGKLQVILRK
jgi:hypothetical protein